MYKQSDQEPQVKERRAWLNQGDIELIFLNAIVLCALLLAIVAADVLMS